MSTAVETLSGSRASPAPRPWIYGPWLDLVVGCGAWSAPLLAVAAWLTPANTHGWAVGFYLLAIVFNYPHFMATIYRAYHAREDFEKYKFFTLHVTLLLAATAVVMHASPRLFPWVFTLYICWSPWHYTGQNYGLMMMFVRRSGASVTPNERQWLHAAFWASYLTLLASFETGGTSDPLILSLGLPAKITLPVRVALGATFTAFVFLGFRTLVQRTSLRAMAAPLVLAATQFLWFILPTLLELHASYQIPQTRYSSGILAVLHSTQYLWITSYYQQREARADGQSGWRLAAYFVTLIAGGIALFIPGPWLVSRVFHYDFTTSFLIFTALVNIHHFILDGALWKLRDSRIASLLIDRGGKAAGAEATQPKAGNTVRWLGGRVLSAPIFRIGVVVLLFLWGGIDQLHFALGTDEGNLSALERAAKLDPYDSMLQARVATAESRAGRRDQAVAALERAVALTPHNAALQHACAKAMLEDGLYTDAYSHYQKMLAIFPRDPDALLNYGLLAARLGHPDEAIESWEKAVDASSEQANVHLYLAEALDQRGEHAAAARHWEAFLKTAITHPDDPAAGEAQQISAAIQLADDEAQLRRSSAAVAGYLSAIALAERVDNPRLESLALSHLAEFQEKSGELKAALHSYQRSLGLDAKSGDKKSEAIDWFNYGQFLRRHALAEELPYACFLHSEALIAGTGGAEIETVRTARRELEGRLGKKSAAVEKNLPQYAARAASVPESAF